MRAALSRGAPHPSATSTAQPDGLSRDSLATLMMRATWVGLEFLCALVVARRYGAAAYGALAFVTACLSLLAIPAALGFDRLLLREAAVLRARQQLGELRALLRTATRLSLAASWLLALIVAGASVAACQIAEDLPSALLLGAAALPLLTYARIRQSVIQGLGKVIPGQLPETLIQPLMLLALVSLLPAPGFAQLPIVAYLCATASACCAGIWLLRQVQPSWAQAHTVNTDPTAWLKRGLPFVWMLGMSAVLNYADVVIVGLASDAADAGMYRVASHAAMLVAFPLTAMNLAAAPRIATAFAQQDATMLQQIATSAARRALLVCTPVLVLLILFGKPALSLFGAQFVNAYPALVILGIGYLSNAAAGASGYLLIMTKHETAAALCFTLAAVSNITGNLVLTPLWGIQGAACATALSLVILNISFIVTVRRQMALSATALHRLTRRSECSPS